MSVLGSSKTETTWVAARDVVDFHADLLYLIDFKLCPSKDFLNSIGLHHQKLKWMPVLRLISFPKSHKTDVNATIEMFLKFLILFDRLKQQRRLY